MDCRDNISAVVAPGGKEQKLWLMRIAHNDYVACWPEIGWSWRPERPMR